MDQKQSHNITPKPNEGKPRIPRLKTEREQEQEDKQALISRDRGKVKRREKRGPLSVGFDHSQD